MEKYLQTGNSLFMGVISVVIGLILVIWPDHILGWLVTFVGVVSLVIGVTQFVGFLFQTKGVKNRWTRLPLLSVVMVIWGILLLVHPSVWVNLFMILMSIPMLFLAINQMVALVRARKAGLDVLWGYFVFPVLLFLSGLVVLWNPFSTAEWLVIFAGAWIIAHGVMEIFDYFSLRR